MRRLYGRLLDSVAATWAVGLILSQGMLILTGPSMQGISSPFGSFSVGADELFLVPGRARRRRGGAAGRCSTSLFMKTKYGLRARATIQNPSIARALGVDTARMYTLTFALGSALAGLAGRAVRPHRDDRPLLRHQLHRGDKTEQPTPKKLDDARKKGDVPKSKEVSSTVGLIVWLALGALTMTYATTRIGTLYESLFTVHRPGLGHHRLRRRRARARRAGRRTGRDAGGDAAGADGRRGPADRLSADGPGAAPSRSSRPSWRT